MSINQRINFNETIKFGLISKILFSMCQIFQRPFLVLFGTVHPKRVWDGKIAITPVLGLPFMVRTSYNGYQPEIDSLVGT